MFIIDYSYFYILRILSCNRAAVFRKIVFLLYELRMLETNLFIGLSLSQKKMSSKIFAFDSLQFLPVNEKNRNG